jgi:uncharacterized protein
MLATRRSVLTVAAAFAAGSARALLADDLYTATAVVTGYDMRSRPAGFASCLTEVLVKITGDPSLHADPAAEAAARNADRYVAGFDYFDPIAHRRPHDDQGSYDRSYELTVRFDRGRTDALASSLGRKLWTEKRPLALPVIRMHGESRPWLIDFPVTADDPRAEPQREALLNAGRRYGIGIRFPEAALVPALEAAMDQPEPDTMTRAEAMLVVGAVRFRPEDFGWTGGWRTRWLGRSYRAEVRGVPFDAAFDRLVRGVVQVAAHTGPFG